MRAFRRPSYDFCSMRVHYDMSENCLADIHLSVQAPDSEMYQKAVEMTERVSTNCPSLHALHVSRSRSQFYSVDTPCFGQGIGCPFLMAGSGDACRRVANKNCLQSQISFNGTDTGPSMGPNGRLRPLFAALAWELVEAAIHALQAPELHADLHRQIAEHEVCYCVG